MTDNEDDDRALYHPQDVVHFGKTRAVLMVRPDGETWPYLLADDTAPPGCGCPHCAPHEQLGSLPLAVRRRLNRCQATGSTTRRRCGNPAPISGRYCHTHAESGH